MRWRALAFGCVVSALAVVGCTSVRHRMTGGTPAIRPASMDGTIVDGRYFAADGSFSVRLPHAPESFEAHNLQIRDGQSGAGGRMITYVIFGPGPTDPAGYHVILAPRSAARETPSLAERAARITESYMHDYNAAYHGAAERLVFTRTETAGRPAIYAVYRYRYGDDDVPDEFYVVFEVIEVAPGRVVNVMAEKLTVANPWNPGLDTLVAGRWTRFNDFAESVEVGD